MPREFYPDTKVGVAASEDEANLCLVQITMFDGPGICVRSKNHKVDETNPTGPGEFHQEGLEGWVWNDNGLVG